MSFSNAETDRISLTARGQDGEPITGVNLRVSIQDISTGFYFDGAAFTAAFTEFAMIQTDITNLPGVYHYDFTSPVPNIRVKYYARALTDDVGNGPWEGEAQIGKWVDDVISARKHVRNKIEFSGNRYTLYEDDKSTIFEEGDVSSQSREPDL